MKKYLFPIILICFIFLGCGQKPINEHGWYTDLETCMKQARKKQKDIFLLFSRDDADKRSVALKEKIFYTKEFSEKFSPDYEFCNLDYSLERIAKSQPPKDATAQQKREAANVKKQVERDMQNAVIYSANDTPSILILNDEGIVLDTIFYIPSGTPEDFFVSFLEETNEKVNFMSQKILDVKKSKGIEKVKAIDALYDATENTYKYSLKKYILEVPKLDKENETQLVGKYILASATSKSLECYLNRTPEKASDAYLDVVSSPMLNSAQQQQCYYGAAYIVAKQELNLETYEKIISYLEAAIAIDPTSKLGIDCNVMLSRVKERLEYQKDMDAKRALEESEE